jgi:heptosyltransferase II
MEIFKPPVARSIVVLCPDCAVPALPHSGTAGNLALLVPCEGRVNFWPFGFTCERRAATDGLVNHAKRMNINSPHSAASSDQDQSPILIIPYMWIGDFVRGHTVVRVLKERWPDRPVDLLTTTQCAPLVDYMPGVRKGLVWNLPRSRLALRKQWGLAALLRSRGYKTALVLPRTWKSAIAPTLAGIPERIGFVGEFRFGLINHWRWGEKRLPRFIDKNAALALPDGTPLPPEWPVPQLQVPADDVVRWREANGLGAGPAIALAPGSVGSAKRWTYYAEAARLLALHGLDVWVVGGPAEKAQAAEIVAAGGPTVRDLTGNDLRNGILAMAAASVAISNDSGLMHVAAALDTPTMGIFGPTSPYHWGPLNGLAATVQTKTHVPCQPCHRPVCRLKHHRCMRDIPAADVVAIAEQVLAETAAR